MVYLTYLNIIKMYLTYLDFADSSNLIDWVWTININKYGSTERYRKSSESVTRVMAHNGPLPVISWLYTHVITPFMKW